MISSDDVLGGVTLAATAVGLRQWARSRAAERRALPRLCSCGHGSGPHGPDGCKGRVMHVEHVELKAPEWCGCLVFDASGPRAPR